MAQQSIENSKQSVWEYKLQHIAGKFHETVVKGNNCEQEHSYFTPLIKNQSIHLLSKISLTLERW